jgi:YD repeat-containing protein
VRLHHARKSTLPVKIDESQLSLTPTILSLAGESAVSLQTNPAFSFLRVSTLAFSAPLTASSDDPQLVLSSVISTTMYHKVGPAGFNLMLPPDPSSSIVISQIYGGGGNSGATYKNDFIELFNRGNASVDLTGWSVQYAAATGSTWQTTQLSGSLAAGHYYLVKEVQGSGGTTNLPTPDATGTIDLSATAGKVASSNSSAALTVSCPSSNASVIDFVGYGSTASCYEGSGAAPAPSNTNAILRARLGCIETDNNPTDFDPSAANPRNTSTAANTCSDPGGSSTVVISEFRTRGVAGGNDEFVEIYNKTNAAINISGWKIKASNNAGAVTTRITITANTTLPAHGHFLVAKSGTDGYSGTVAADQTYSTSIADDGGIAVTKADDTVVDQVGMSSGSVYKENRTLAPLTTNTDRTDERRPGSTQGSPQDTNDGPSDFQVRTTSDPQNLQSAATPANEPPVSSPGGPYSGIIAQNVPFTGGNSSDSDGSIVSYSWAFGDGGTGSGVGPVHPYAAAGSYTVTLTVTDNLGAQTSATTSVSISSSSSDQYSQNFLQWGLGRAPQTPEESYWTDITRAAYQRGQSSVALAMTEFGMTVFESAEYADRQRTPHQYVYDLYKTYLMREPDEIGWEFWEGQCNTYGREQVRNAFEESAEFQGIVATLAASGAPSSSVSSLSSARVDPFNQPGNQLRARDAEWSTSLLSLPGRAGLDLGLGLSYSSGVWTRSGPYTYFDRDIGRPSPGFRLGFPTVEDISFDAQVGVNVRHLITSSGQRVELRQVGTTNVFEAADSSYLQLKDNGSSLTVSSTDGTIMSYSKYLEWECTEIKDRNGNYISVNYDWRGDIQTIVDTLGRTITFTYDSNANITSITQDGRTDPWVTFGWGTTTMQPIAGTAVVGTHSNAIIPVVNFIGFSDQSYYRFSYTQAGSGQVSRVTRYASDSDPDHDTHELAHTQFNYDASDDSTRLSSTSMTAENWTGINGVPTEVVTRYGIEGDTHTVSVDGDPNATAFKESYGTGWQQGLVVSVEVRTGVDLQKTTTTTWTKDDNTSNNFSTNPRVIETNTIDSVQNHTRTTIDYGPHAQYGLPSVVAEFSVANNVVTELRRSH